ncbi:hypothetical protein Btru_057171 [Bulinus truncatus]|nr:hypothetical protein Btru_057171 [Bulinus truncatus]
MEASGQDPKRPMYTHTPPTPDTRKYTHTPPTPDTLTYTHTPPTPDTQQCKKSIVGLIFVLDNSLSIGKANYKKEIQLTSELISVFNVAPNAARVGALVFNRSPQKLFDLNIHPYSSGVLQALEKAPPLKLGTFTDLALNFVVDDGMFSPRAGGRPNVNNVVVVLTDGLSRSVVKTERAAQRVRAQNTIIVAVGFGAANDRELKRIATRPDYVFKAKDIDQLLATKWNVAELLCKASVEEPVVTPEPTSPAPIRTTAGPSLCLSKTDIIFVLDSSGSIGQSNFDRVLNFVANLVRRFPVGPSASRFGSVVFSHVAKKMFDLRDFEDQETIIERLNQGHSCPLTGVVVWSFRTKCPAPGRTTLDVSYNLTNSVCAARYIWSPSLKLLT